MKALLLASALAACTDTTGGTTVEFSVAAAGPADGGSVIDTALGWHVVLDKAVLHVGAIYLNRSVPSSGTQFTNCILPGIYTAEERSSLDVDVLSPVPQLFPALAHGTDDEVVTGEVWLTGGDVNAKTDPTVIADIAGTATSGSEVRPFTASVTISGNRAIPSNPAQPSAHPICKQRIVTPIAVDLRPVNDGRLLVRIDPAIWFANVNFFELPESGDSPPSYVFPDDLSISASQNLFTGLRAATGTYTFSFE